MVDGFSQSFGVTPESLYETAFLEVTVIPSSICGVAICVPSGSSDTSKVAEHQGSFLLEQFKYLQGDRAYLPVRKRRSAHLDEVTPGADVSGNEHLGLGRVGKDCAGRLSYRLAAVGIILEPLSR